MKVLSVAFLIFCFYSCVESYCCYPKPDPCAWKPDPCAWKPDPCACKPDPCACKPDLLSKIDMALEKKLQMKSKFLMYKNLHRQMHRCRHCNAAPCGTFSPVEPLSSCQLGKPITFSTFDVYPSQPACDFY